MYVGARRHAISCVCDGANRRMQSHVVAAIEYTRLRTVDDNTMLVLRKASKQSVN